MKQDTSNTAQAMWIGIGSLFSFLFSIVSAAILSRFLSKADYGTYKQVMYVYTTLLSVFTLGLPLAYSYFLPRVSLAEGKTLVNRLNACFVVLGAVFSAVLFFGADVIAEILKNPDLTKQIKIFSPSPMLILPTMGLQGVLATYKRTLWNAIYVILTRIFMLLLVALPVALIKPSVEIALWGFNISSLVSCVLALVIKNIPFKGIIGEKCPVSYKEIFIYSIPLMVAGLLGVAISAADQFYVSRYFGQEVFADFANGSLELPFVGMVLSAGGTVLLPVFSRMIKEQVPKREILNLWERTAVKAAYILYPLIIFCIFFAKEIMTFIYGDMYETSAIYFRIMLLANFFTVIQFYPIILALGKTKEYAFVHILTFFLVWGFEYVAVVYFHTVVYVTIISVLCKIIKILLMMKIVADAIGTPIWSLFPVRKLSSTFASCLSAGALVFFIIRLIPLQFSELPVLIIGFTLYAVIVYFLGKIMKVDYLDVIRPLTDKYFKR